MLLEEGCCIDGRHTVVGKIGQGKAGGAVYDAKEARTNHRVALKYPVLDHELEVLKALNRGSIRALGVPELRTCGTYDGKPYAVTDFLGPPLSEVLRKIQRAPLPSRWPALGALGRMVLRRLEAIHRCGFVHNDVQPENILVEHGGGAEGRRGPFLIDYGWARPFPGGGRMREYWGSVDFSSIQSAYGGDRDPYDDLEALGWVLCHGLFGELPWFHHTRSAVWCKGRPERLAVCDDVKDAKLEFLRRTSFGPKWSHLAKLPTGLLDFLLLASSGGDTFHDRHARDGEYGFFDPLCKYNSCNGEPATLDHHARGAGDSRKDLPDYATFATLLGGSHQDPDRADREDLAFFHECLENRRMFSDDDDDSEDDDGSGGVARAQRGTATADVEVAGLRGLPEPERPPARPPVNRKLRVLVLHTGASNSNLLKFQTTKLRRALGRPVFGMEVQWLMPDGLVPWEPRATGDHSYFAEKTTLEKRLAGDKPFVSWFGVNDNLDIHREEFYGAVRWLERYVAEQAPIDVAMAFGQSTGLLDRLTDEYQSQGSHVPWRITVQFNGIPPIIAPPKSALPLWQPVCYVTAPTTTHYKLQKAMLPQAYKESVFLEHGDGDCFPLTEPRASEIYETLGNRIKECCGFPQPACA